MYNDTNLSITDERSEFFFLHNYVVCNLFSHKLVVNSKIVVKIAKSLKHAKICKNMLSKLLILNSFYYRTDLFLTLQSFRVL